MNSFPHSKTGNTVATAVFCIALLGCASTTPKSPATTSAPAKTAPVLFMAGDSTMSLKPLFPAQPERGWGQILPVYFKQGVVIHDLAMNGRSTKSFRDEGRWQTILDQLKPGDYVLIQFGHNDSKKDDPKRYADPFGSFKANFEQFVREVRERKGLPILATPIVRRSFAADGKLRPTHGDYPPAIRQVASELKVPLLDLEKRSSELVEKLGPEASKKLYMTVAPGEFASLPEGKTDDTHLNAFGASRICDLATDELRSAVPELAEWLVAKK